MKKILIAEIISYLFILLFLYTGISKVLEYSVFKEQIALVPIFKKSSSFVALAIPVTEFIISVLLFWPSWRLKGLYASLGLMSLFTTYIIYILNLDQNLPCSCGGFIEALSWEQHIIFNCIMIVLTAIAIFIMRRRSLSDNSNLVFTH